jgi:hypothetical protein
MLAALPPAPAETPQPPAGALVYTTCPTPGSYPVAHFPPQDLSGCDVVLAADTGAAPGGFGSPLSPQLPAVGAKAQPGPPAVKAADDTSSAHDLPASPAHMAPGAMEEGSWCNSLPASGPLMLQDSLLLHRPGFFGYSEHPCALLRVSSGVFQEPRCSTPAVADAACSHGGFLPRASAGAEQPVSPLPPADASGHAAAAFLLRTNSDGASGAAASSGGDAGQDRLSGVAAALPSRPTVEAEAHSGPSGPWLPTALPRLSATQLPSPPLPLAFLAPPPLPSAAGLALPALQLPPPLAPPQLPLLSSSLTPLPAPAATPAAQPSRKRGRPRGSGGKAAPEALFAALLSDVSGDEAWLADDDSSSDVSLAPDDVDKDADYDEWSESGRRRPAARAAPAPGARKQGGSGAGAKKGEPAGWGMWVAAGADGVTRVGREGRGDGVAPAAGMAGWSGVRCREDGHASSSCSDGPDTLHAPDTS